MYTENKNDFMDQRHFKYSFYGPEVFFFSPHFILRNSILWPAYFQACSVNDSMPSSK